MDNLDIGMKIAERARNFSLEVGEASGNYEIRNPTAYLKACVYNTIYEMDIELDSKLRSAGLI